MTMTIVDTVSTEERYRTEGFTVAASLVSKTEAGKVAAELERLWRDPNVRHSKGQYSDDGLLVQIVNPFMFSPLLLDLEMRTAAAELAMQILSLEVGFPLLAGTEMRRMASMEPRLIGEMAMIKQPGQDAVIWHQDEAHWDPGFAYRQVNVWVSLTDVTLTDGYMMFVPGSHFAGLLPHVPKNSAQYPDLGLPSAPSKWVECKMHAGDASVHGSRTVHASAPNRSNRLRYSYSFTFGYKPVRRMGDGINNKCTDESSMSRCAEKIVPGRKDGIVSELR